MTRRNPDAEFTASAGPLFDAAERRAATGMSRASNRAERVEPGWRQDAIDAVRAFAETHATFLAEQVGIVIPASADPRASGQIMRAAEKLGYVRADGFERAASSNGSAKVRWASRIFQGARA